MPDLNKYSSRITQPKSQGASQAMFFATGLTSDDLIDIEHGTLDVQKPDEPDHGVQRDARELLPILFAGIAGQQLGAMDVDEVDRHGRNGGRFSHSSAPPAQIIRQIVTRFGQSRISPAVSHC